MKITCDSCQSKYNVSDEKVQGKTVKIRCKKCGATLIVNGAGAHSAPAADVPPGGAADASFTVNVADGDQRTMSMSEIVAAYNERVVDQETFVWTDGMGDWMPLGQVESIVMALNAPSSHEQAAPVAPAYEPPAYEPPPAFAAPAAEERRAAVVKREGSRGTRDLFGGGGAAGMEEVASSAPAFDGSGGMPMHASPAGATGQRNETSVLFSLSALTRTETPAPVAVTGGGSRKEDSGLIDLKALTESAAATSRGGLDDAPAALFPSTVGSPFASPFGAPLGSFDAPAVPVGSIAPPAQKKNMAVILVIAATVVALAAIIAVAIVVKSGRDRDTAAAAAAASASAAAAAAPTTTAEPVASVAPTADPTPTSTASASATVAAAAKKPPPGGVKPPPGVQPPKPPPGPGDAPPPKPPPPKPPAGGDCGCNGDLMCLMGCRAKK